jgi:hypothetical protein
MGGLVFSPTVFRLLEGSVHPLDLTIGPRMVWLGQPVLDTIGRTKHVEHMDAPSRYWPEASLRQISKLDAIVGEHSMDFVGYSFY